MLNAGVLFNKKRTRIMRPQYEWEESVSAFLRNGLFVFAMFCSGCHSQLFNAVKFCHVSEITITVKDKDLFCVAQLEVESSERKRHQTTPLTFEEYRERKERNEPPGLLQRKAARLKTLFI